MKQWNLIRLSERALLLHYNEDLEQYKELPIISDDIIKQMLDDASRLKNEPKLLFSGDGKDSEEHIKKCKIKGCSICKELKEFLKRCEEDSA